MASRKEWRTRDASANEEVLALLEAIREGMGAERVGLFDDDRGDPSGNRSALAFWDAFDEGRCTDIDWNPWYHALRAEERAHATCGCGARHRLDGFLIHGRWALVLISPTTPSGMDAAVITSALRALAGKLPPCRSHLDAPFAERERQRLELEDRGDKDSSDEDSGRETSGHPLFWLRKRRD